MKLRICEIMQDCDKIDIDNACEVFNRNCIVEWAYIRHDKDIDKDGVAIRPHYHIMLKFNDSQDTKYIAKWFGVAENYVEKCKTTWANMLKYLTHDNAQGKYSYDMEEVISNFDVKIAKESPIGDDRLNDILDLIDREEMREYNYMDYVTLKEYTKYKRQILDAYSYVNDRLSKGVDREMEVVFITGGSGTGKTTYAKAICDDHGYSYYVSSGGKNPLDDYKGQDAVILDDMRASDYKYNELLKMLDNNTSSRVGCRYYNKSMCYCKMIIITSVLPMEDWYRSLQEHESEPLLQLKRRCKSYAKMTMENIEMGRFLPSKGEYYWRVVPNTALKQFNANYTEEEALDDIMSVFGVTMEMIEDYKKHPEDFIDVSEQCELPFD